MAPRSFTSFQSDVRIRMLVPEPYVPGASPNMRIDASERALSSGMPSDIAFAMSALRFAAR